MRAMVDQFFNVLSLIVYLAIIATVVSSQLTRGIIEALGNAFAGSISAAKH